MKQYAVERVRYLNFNYISIFSGGGIGDIGFRKAGLTPIIMNELEVNRSQLIKLNFPNTKVLTGDIENHVDNIISDNSDKKIFMLSATPPCQGMSKNGIGSILKAIRDGKRPPLDERNQLFLYALKLVEKIKPDFFFFENVDRMQNTFYYNELTNEKVLMPEYIKNKMIEYGYCGDFKLIDFSDYGVPQKRQRLVGLFTKIEGITTESLFNFNEYKVKGQTLKEVIGKLEPLDSINKESSMSKTCLLHKVPVSRSDLYYWIANTKEGESAFKNNTCSFCEMRTNDNNRIYCENCEALLPKPIVKDKTNGELRLIKGFTSAYKRMEYDKIAPTITTRSAYAGSDNNIHPVQNRVLSIYEVMLLQGIVPEEYKLGPIEKKTKSGKLISSSANDTLVRDVLGEPVSPLITEMIGNHLKKLLLT